jgi:hypothetical protein
MKGVMAIAVVGAVLGEGCGEEKEEEEVNSQY